MALPMIETGYKPEGALGALYQGFNAGNADQGAELELIKQFLANQHAQVQNPLDEQTTAQNLLASHYKTSPEYQQGMTNTIEGQGLSSLTAGQNAQMLQPFKQRVDQREAQNQFKVADQRNQIYQIDDLIQTEQNPLQRMALMKERDRITRNLRETPEFTGKRELRETGTDSAEYIAELRAAQARQLAAEKAARGPENKDDAEKAYVRLLKQQYADGAMSLEQLQAALVDVQNKKFAKPEQQGIKPVMTPEGGIALSDKAPTPQITPGGPKAPTLPSGWTMK